MNRWSSNSYKKNGLKEGFKPEYLDALVRSGKGIQRHHNPVIFTLAHLARCTDTQYRDLHEFVSRKNYESEKSHYRTFTIKKRNGGRRWIHAPHPVLKIVQSWIARNILSAKSVHSSSMAYRGDCSIVDNASVHCESDWLLKLDISNFFHSISERQVYHVFKEMGYSSLLSFELARLCTKVDTWRKGNKWLNKTNPYTIKEYWVKNVGSLPQGAPTSPALSNIICQPLDETLYSLADECGATYTRYADDLTFSFIDSSRSKVLAFKRRVERELLKCGFNLNTKKTRIVPPGARKVVTGLIVNGKSPAIPRQLRDKIKADLYYCKKFGVENHCKKNKYKSIVGFANHMNGMISYVHSVNPQMAHKYWVDFKKLDLPTLIL